MSRRDSWWRAYDEYGQWGFTDRGAYLAMAAMAAMLLIAAWLEGALGCLA